MPMTGADALPGNLTHTLTPHRIVDIAHHLGLPRIAEHARIVLLEQLWLTTNVDAYVLLRLRERMQDRDTIGAAYYSLSKPPAGSVSTILDPRLAPRHQTNIRHGRERCATEWQLLSDAWGQSAKPSAKGFNRCDICKVHIVQIANMDTASMTGCLLFGDSGQAENLYHDIVGKLATVVECMAEWRYGDQLGWDGLAMMLKLKRIKLNMINWFGDEDELLNESSNLEARQFPVTPDDIQLASPSTFEVVMPIEHYSMSLCTGLMTLSVGSVKYEVSVEFCAEAETYCEMISIGTLHSSLKPCSNATGDSSPMFYT